MTTLKTHEKYYTHNTKYAHFLETQDIHNFDKYVQTIIDSSKAGDKVLDVGCGTGLALEYLRAQAKRKVFGVDVSKASIKIAKAKKLDCDVYSGAELPFSSKSFDVVGSINTLEHTDNPEQFLDENIRVLKKNGILIIACPNFLSVTNNYHHHTRGFKQKLSNLWGLLRRSFSQFTNFEKMHTIDKEDFEPDDDACNVTNPIDIVSWGRKNKLQVVSISAHQIHRTGLLHALDFYPLNALFGSCFIVFKKIS